MLPGSQDLPEPSEEKAALLEDIPLSDFRKGTPTDVTPWMKLAAAAALFPIVDFCSDIALFVVMLDNGWWGWALCIAMITILFLRFISLYAALSPATEVSNYVLIYIPFLALPYFNEVTGHATGDVVDDIYEKAGILNTPLSLMVRDAEGAAALADDPDPQLSPPPRAPTAPAASVGTEAPPTEATEASQPRLYGAQPGDFYEFLYDAHGDMEKYGGGMLGRLYFIVTHEFEVTFISLFLGPMLLFDMCSRVAIERIRKTPQPTVDGDGIQAYHREVTELIPAAFCAAPQICLLFVLVLVLALSHNDFMHKNNMNYLVLGFSILCSVISINLALSDLRSKLTYLFDFISPVTIRKQVAKLMAKLDAGMYVPTSDLGDAIRAALDADGDDEPGTPLGPALRAATVRLLMLRGRDVRRRVLRSGAEIASLLKDEGYVAVEMNEAQVGVVSKDIEISTSALDGKRFQLEALYTPAQLRAGWYTATDLHAAGFSAKELADAGYLASELLHAGFGAAALKEVGFNAIDLRTAGFRLAALFAASFDAAALVAAGFTAKELKEECGFGAAALLSTGCPPSELREAGFSAYNLREAGCKLASCKKAGYGLQELKNAGFSVIELKRAGCTATELKEAGFLVIELAPAYSAAEKKAGGYSLGELRAGGVSLSELSTLSYDVDSLLAAGFLAFEFRHAQYSAKQLKKAHGGAGAFSTAELKAAGFSATELVQDGFSLHELVGAFKETHGGKEGRLHELLAPRTSRGTTSIFTVAQLKEAGYDAPELRAVGFTWADLKEADFSNADLKAAGASAKELEKAGLSVEELMGAGYGEAELATLSSRKAAVTVTKKQWLSPSKRLVMAHGGSKPTQV